MGTLQFVLAVWTLLFMAQLLVVSGMLASSLVVGLRPTAVAVAAGPTLFRLKLGGITWTLKLLPIGSSVAYDPPGDEADEVSALERAGLWRRLLITLSVCILPALLAIALLGVDLTGHHLRTGFAALVEPSQFPDRVARFRGLLAEGHLASALGILLTKFLAFHLLPFPGLPGGALLMIPLRKLAPELTSRLMPVGILCLWGAIAVFLVAAAVSWKRGSGEEARGTVGTAESPPPARAPKPQGVKQQSFREPDEPPLELRDFVSPFLLIGALAVTIGGAAVRARRELRHFNERFGSLLEGVGYRRPSGIEKELPELSKQVMPLPVGTQLIRDFHGLQIQYTVAPPRDERSGRKEQWCVPARRGSPSWHLQSRKFVAPESWHRRSIPLDDDELDRRFRFRGDRSAFEALLGNDRHVRPLLLGLGWVDLQLGDGVGRFREEAGRNVSTILGGSVGVQLSSPDEVMEVTLAVHEQIAELLARVARATR